MKEQLLKEEEDQESGMIELTVTKVSIYMFLCYKLMKYLILKICYYIIIFLTSFYYFFHNHQDHLLMAISFLRWSNIITDTRWVTTSYMMIYMLVYKNICWYFSILYVYFVNDLVGRRATFKVSWNKFLQNVYLME